MMYLKVKCVAYYFLKYINNFKYIKNIFKGDPCLANMRRARGLTTPDTKYVGTPCHNLGRQEPKFISSSFGRDQ